MKINQIKRILVEGGIEPNEAKIEAEMLVKHFLGVNDKDLLLNSEFEDENMREVVQAAQLRASKRIPIQHIMGTAYFMGEDFIVNEHVLIPRDETELLVRKAVELVEKLKGLMVERTFLTVKPFNHSTIQPKVLDIGTGSGCIACMIAKLTQTQVMGVDISLEALQVSLDNASKLGLFNKAIFRKSDLFSKIRENEKFDLIVSNPPYIPLKEKKSLQVEVGFEPESALFASDNEGIEFYDKIITKAPDFLNDGGYLLFELGINQADKVKELMQKRGFKNIEVKKDLAGIERIISAEKMKRKES